MDFKLFLSVILGLACFRTAWGRLRCVECTHIYLYPTNSFPESDKVYQILRQRNNPACAMTYPLDRRAYEEQQALNNQQSQNTNPLMFPTNNYQVSETICAAFSDTNKCNYIHGDVDVYLGNYDATVRLNMHVRDCENVPDLENKCYLRDTANGYYEVKNFFQDRLAFLSRDLQVTRFRGTKCVCNTDLCSPEVSAAVIKIQGFSFVFVSLLVSYFLSKFYHY